MAANYWTSSHHKHWLFTKDELAAKRQKLEEENADLVKTFPLPDVRHLYIYFNQQLNRLSKRLKIRHQAIATAQVYIKRLYTRLDIRRTNPYLVLATALYLACKIEETPQHIRLVVNEARILWQDFLHFETTKVGECEYLLISEMSSQLIVFQPYRTLASLQADLRLSAEDYGLAHQIINDHYMTDLPLLHAPHVVALTAILLALVLRPNNGPQGQGQQGAGGSAASSQAAAAAAVIAQTQKRMAQGQAAPSAASGAQGGPAEGSPRPLEAKVGRVQRFVVWLADSGVDIAAMADCTQEILSFYNAQDQYNDKLTRESVARFVKARGLDK